MRKAFGLFGVRLSAVLAMAVSAALFVDYRRPVPTFCAANSGCAAVRASGFGYVVLGGVPVAVPIFGLLGFSLLLGVSLTRGLRHLLPLVAGVGGLIALGLFGLQLFKIQRLCSLCVTVDLLAVIAAVGGFLFWGGSGDADEEFALRRATWPVFALIALAAPLLWAVVQPAAPVPTGVQAQYRPNKINVVEFADYECPFCRALHPVLQAVIASYPDQVHFTRLNLPLKSHEFAHGAAQAQVCARAQGKGDIMANRLFAAEDLRSETNRALAEQLGVELTAYDRCIASGDADRTIDAESKILLDSGLQGLPTTYVGAKTIIGAQPEEVFRDAFESAARGEGMSGISASVYWPCVLLLVLGVGWVGRVRRAMLEHATTR